MKIIKYIYISLAMTVSISVLFLSSKVALGYWSRPGHVDSLGDFIILISPVIAPIIGLVLGILVMTDNRKNNFTTAIFNWAFGGATIYMMLPAYQLITNYSLFSRDGTAYWAGLMMPTFIIGIPILIIFSCIGLIIGWIKYRRLKI